MTGFSHIEIDGYRRLRGIDLELRSLCVLIGANGSGKSSFLEALSLLAASAHGELAAKISDAGGIHALASIGEPPVVSFSLQRQLPIGLGRMPLHPIDYHLQLGISGNSYVIMAESLIEAAYGHDQALAYIRSVLGNVTYATAADRSPITPSWQFDLTETSLFQVPKTYRESEEFRQRLASSTFYHALNVDQGSRVRLPQPMQPASLPGKDGEHLASCLYALRETNRDRFEAIEDALHAAFPNFERLEFPPVANGTLALNWRENPLSKSISAHQLSEGTLRFLWLTTLLQSPGLTEVTLIDEPEVSLHPELLSLLADLLREASTRSQIIVATHSDLLVRFLKPEEVLVVDLDDEGAARLTWADTLDLDQWLQEYTLDEVWRMGRLGGRR